MLAGAGHMRSFLGEPRLGDCRPHPRPMAWPSRRPRERRVGIDFMGPCAARLVVGTVPGTVPCEGERPPSAGGVAPPSRVQSRARVASGIEDDADHGVGHQRARVRAVLVHGPSLIVICWIGRRCNRLAPRLDSPGVLDRVKVSLAPLAADATLTRSARALGEAIGGASRCSRACSQQSIANGPAPGSALRGGQCAILAALGEWRALPMELESGRSSPDDEQ